MTIGASIFLIALGAILKYAVDVTVSGLTLANVARPLERVVQVSRQIYDLIFLRRLRLESGHREQFIL